LPSWPFFIWEKRGFGCNGGSAGEVVVVVATERVTCWTTFLCSCGGWCRVGVVGGGGWWRGGGQSRIIIALQDTMNGLLFGGLLCPHLFASTEEEKERERHSRIKI